MTAAAVSGARWLREMPSKPGIYVVACNLQLDLGYVHELAGEDGGRLVWMVPAVSSRWQFSPSHGPAGWWWWSEPIEVASVPDWFAPASVSSGERVS